MNYLTDHETAPEVAANSFISPLKLQTAVLFLVFNRPDITSQVFEAIRNAKPPRLYIAADGPRSNRPDEKKQCNEVRRIATNVDWPCTVKTLFREENLGCKYAVSSGISWFFEHEEQGIILEDDCLPSDAFFHFCSEMLEKYEKTPTVYAISGSYFGNAPVRAGHYFSRYALMWGWATWRNRWKNYEIDPSDYIFVLIRTWPFKPVTFLYWLEVIKSVLSGKLNTWDIQWIFTVWRQNAIACRPNRNLVKNLGFGENSTHTTDSNSELGRLRISTDTKGLNRALSGLTPDKILDSIDEKCWAMINIRSVLIMKFPKLVKIISYLR